MKRITRARIEAFLASAEQPEIILPQLTEELAEKVAEAGNAEAKALAAVKAARRRLDEAAGRAARMGNGARLAIQAGEVRTARQALAAQIAAEQRVEQCRHEVQTAEDARRDAQAVRQRLQDQLEDLRLRQSDILARAREARAKAKVAGRAVSSLLADGRNLLDEVARMEAKVDEAEAEVQIADEIAQSLGLGAQPEPTEDLADPAEVDRRLARLKEELGGP